ncbi:MAG: putative Na+/H+ antiporter, partial [Bdellovibrionaceae bacterium]|nr:putative Na+/H+ antiporter [Pseudobdellovibrionaceae bacterium]
MGTIIFSLAVLHTFLVSFIMKLSHRFPPNTFLNSFFHLLAEIEVVFGFWAGIFMAWLALSEGPGSMIKYLQSVNFTEPLFVFVIMVVASSKPILLVARDSIAFLAKIFARILRTPLAHTEIFVILSFGSLMGSFITEPAAITVSGLLLHSMLRSNSPRMAYALLAVLFVNISIGGGLTP